MADFEMHDEAVAFQAAGDYWLDTECTYAAYMAARANPQVFADFITAAMCVTWIASRDWWRAHDAAEHVDILARMAERKEESPGGWGCGCSSCRGFFAYHTAPPADPGRAGEE